MPTSDPEYGTPTWKRTRLIVLARDRYECQIRGPRCSTFATDADHIVARADGGAMYDLANLRAACRACNGGRGAAMTNRRRAQRDYYETRF